MLFSSLSPEDLAWIERETGSLSMSDAAFQAGMRTTPMLELVDALCLRALDGDRVVMSTPPQEGKSTRVSVLFPVAAMQRVPGLKVAVASYSADLALQFSRRARELTRRLYGPGTIVQGEGAAASWSTTNGSSYTAVGVGGGFTGRAVDLLIVDDPVKNAEEVRVKRNRELVWDWWQSVALTRLAPGAGVMVIMTRWHTDDLAGRLIGEGWERVNIPARAVAGGADPLGRQEGEWLTSVRGRTSQQWEATRAALSDYFWQALYQGEPVPSVGKLLDPSLLRSVSYKSLDLRVQEGSGTVWAPHLDIVTSWDLSFTGDAGSDYVVGQVWGTAGDTYYLLDQVRGRWAFADTMETVKQLARRWPQARTHYVEQAANGAALIDMLRRDSGLHVTPVHPRGSKELRAMAVQPLLKTGRVRVVQELEGYAELVEELSQFPSGKNDDQVDALTQALNSLRGADTVRLT